MKHCPSCQTTYTDETLKYCLQDGTPLQETPDSQMKTVAFGDEETVISSRQVEPIRVPVQQTPPPQQILTPQVTQTRQESYFPPVVEGQPEVQKSRTGATVALTVLGTLLLLGIVGAAMMFMRDKKPNEVAVNVNTAPSGSAANRPLNVNSAVSQTLNQPTNQVSNQTANANLSAGISPVLPAAPVVKPTLNPQQAKAVTTDVENAVDDWRVATENLDIDAHLSQYANTVDYYRAGRVGLAQVRADKQRAYSQYDSVNLNISNLKVTPDETGNKATAVFDKEWNFAGEQKNSSGKVQQQLTLSKIGGRWLITGEKDAKVYYINN